MLQIKLPSWEWVSGLIKRQTNAPDLRGFYAKLQQRDKGKGQTQGEKST